ncbi:dual specificity protein phosphatase [Streptomyces azureus]|uniref:Dual specificity protein phosphatase n=1 Tax=Streptomyces azureus TaxID=146537 RepID=A0A0K8PCD2_STRAJ|nr:dual specificity protein phosphatase [Streptomyces azureus]
MSGVTELWNESDAGVLRLPSGRLVRGRGLRHPLDPTAPTPSYGLYCSASSLPRSPGGRLVALARLPPPVGPGGRPGGAGERLGTGRRGARGDRLRRWPGRTGTALACLAVLDGVPGDEAVAYVRRHYDRKAVETPWQRRYVRSFGEG